MVSTFEPSVAAPDVSVLVLAYNHEPYLAQALDGILAQDFPGTFEVLIGEDCSSDNTLGIAAEYARRRPTLFRVISSEQNVGMHANHRRLLAAARGRYIAYCEGDDYWHSPRKLAIEVAHLDDHPGQVGVHSDVDHLVRVNGVWKSMPHYWARNAPDRGTVTTFEDLLEGNTVQTCSVVLRAAVAKSYSRSTLAQNLYAIEDWPLFLHCTLSGPLGVLEASLATYRLVPGSATNQGALANEHRLSDQFRLIHDAATLKPHSGRYRSAGLAATRRALVYNAALFGDRRMLLRAISAGQDYGLDPLRWSRAVTALVHIPGSATAGRLLLEGRRRRVLEGRCRRASSTNWTPDPQGS